MEPDTTGASVRGMAPPKAGRTAGASAFRSLARGGVLAASFAAIERLAGYAGWAGYGEGRSRLLLGLAVAATLGALLARPWNRILAEARGSLVVSILALVGLALLLRKPALLPSTGRPWLDAGIVGLLVLVPFAAHFERRRTAPGFAAAGAAGVVLLGGLWTEPAIGLGFTLILCAGAWAVVEAFAWETDDEASGESAAGLCGLLAAGAAVGAALAVTKPFLLQHLPAEHLGGIALLASSLAIVALGCTIALGLSRAIGGRWTAAIGALLLAGGSFAAWRALAIVSTSRGPSWLAPLHEEASSPARTALAIWAFVALPSAACGLLAKGIWTRGARALAAAVLGIAAGTFFAERSLLPDLDAGGAREQEAAARVRIPPLVQPTGFALNAEGARVRYPVNSSGEGIQMTVWQGIPRGSERGWNRLEACEVLAPKTGAATARGFELLCIGLVQPAQDRALGTAGQGSVLFLDPLPSFDERTERGRNPCAPARWSALPASAVTVLSEPVLSRAGALAATKDALSALAARRPPGTELWVWCDPRPLQPDGVRSALATWRSVFPEGRVHVLLDGYAGPLLGLHVGTGTAATDDVALLELASVPAGDLRTEGAGADTLDRPILESRSEGRAPPFDHPGPESIRAVAGALGLPAGHAAIGVLESLARHAAVQEKRKSLTPSEDRVRVVQAELDAIVEAMRADPSFVPAVRHAEHVAGVLYRKREYDVLLTWMRDLVALRPDVGAFHRYLGLALAELLDRPGALAEMEIAVSLAPESADARAELSKMYADAGRHAEAVRLLESVWQEKPTVEIAKGLGLSCLAIGDFARARQLLEYARAKAPLDGDVEHAIEQLNALQR